jgi:DNA-binding CsgD family transcriptional regulator
VIVLNGNNTRIAGIRVTTSLIDSLTLDRSGRPHAAPGSPYAAQGLGPFGSQFSPTNPRARTTHASLISEILSLLSGHAPAARPSDAAPLEEPLSETELRVLRYLPTNLRGPEIAAELFVSLNTIRTHLRNLYGKLGVHSRADAVNRARELGLLSPTSRQR